MTKTDKWVVVPLPTTDDLVRGTIGQDTDIENTDLFSFGEYAGGLDPGYVADSRQGRIKLGSIKPDLGFLDRHHR